MSARQKPLRLERNAVKLQTAITKLNRQAVESINNPAELAEIDKERIAEMKDLNDAVAELEATTTKPTLAAKIKGWRRESAASQ